MSGAALPPLSASRAARTLLRAAGQLQDAARAQDGGRVRFPRREPVDEAADLRKIRRPLERDALDAEDDVADDDEPFAVDRDGGRSPAQPKAIGCSGRCS